MDQIVRRPCGKKLLTCDLTETELLERGQRLVALQAEIEALEDERREKNAEFRERVKRMSKDVKGIARQIATRREERPVECEMVYDFDRNERSLVRLDTFEAVTRDTISAEERQAHFDDLAGAL